MKWLEIIELRSAGSNSELVMNKLALLIDEINRGEIPQTVQLFVHVNLKADFSIHLAHEKESIESTGSDLGLNIASNLKAYGLVNHNVWLETSTNKNNMEGVKK